MRAVDLFAGAGGFSEGARMAGASVLWAGNHWREAVQVHANNHPDAIHLCQDLHQADWNVVPAHDLLLASPCCQGHSRARGKDRPHHDAARSTAWAVVSAVEAHRPAACIIENVPDYLDWVLYPSWADAMKRLGYHLSHAILDAQYFDVPQERKRVFIVGMRRKVFTFRTTRLSENLVPIRSVLDLSAGEWSPVPAPARIAAGKRPLADATMARIKEGRRRFGREPFWYPYFGSNHSGYSLDRPIWTLTTRDRYALVKGEEMRILTTAEVRAGMGFPEGYVLTGKSKLDKHLLGNAVCPPVARWIIKEVMDAA